MRQIVAYPFGCANEIVAVVGVLFNARCHGKNVRVKNNVFGRKADFFGQNFVRTRTDVNFALIAVRLAFLIERHHDHGRAIAATELRVADKFGDAFLHRDGIDNRLALNALETSFDHAPLRAVDHDRHARNIGLRRDQIHESRHGGLRVEHRLVHVDIDDLRAAFNLLSRDGKPGIIVAVQNQLGKRA